MEQTGLIFTKTKEATFCNITIEADYTDIHRTIDTLLCSLQEMTDDFWGQSERFQVCQLIRALLPSEEQMQLIPMRNLNPPKNYENRRIQTDYNGANQENSYPAQSAGFDG